MNPLGHPVCLEFPDRIAASGWIEHVPFGMYLVDLLRPPVLVELGTHTGVSYCAFCQAVSSLSLPTRCYAVDTWHGDPQAGFYDPQVLADLQTYHDPLYGSFSRLIQSSFDDALSHFADHSIDLLHIDGFHTYDAVQHDFSSWLPKLSDRGVVLVHDINVREQDFGVWRLWEEVSPRYPHLELPHGNGLGLLAVGAHPPPALLPLLQASPPDLAHLRRFFHALGSVPALRNEMVVEAQEHDQVVKAIESRLVDALAQLSDRQRDVDVRTAQVNDLQAQTDAFADGISGLAQELARSSTYETPSASGAWAWDRIVADSVNRLRDAAEQINALNVRLAASDEVGAELRTRIAASDEVTAAMRARVEGWEEHWLLLESTKAWRAVKRWRRVQEGLRSVRHRFDRFQTEPDLESVDLESEQKVVATTLLSGREGLLFEIEQAEWDGVLLTVEGWAVWPPSSSPPRSARLSIGDRALGEARVDLSRPDVSARLQNISTAQRSGFRFCDVLDPPVARTTVLQHVTIEFVDASGSGTQATVPLTMTDGDTAPLDTWKALGAFLSEFHRRIGSDPTILDWNTGLRLATMLPDATIFLPPRSDQDSLLPYIESSVDVVVVGRTDAQFQAEAQRVASHLVLTIGGPGRTVEATWLESPPNLAPPPSVSVIIPVHNNLQYTEACLRRVLETLPSAFQCEVIVIDDGSTDDTPRALERWAASDARIQPLRNDPGVGFLHSSNRGAEASTGDLLVFLNNDTLPQGDWLSPLVRLLADRPDAGAVGGKLVYPDGTLQEAGGVIFSDGSGLNFGKHDSAVDAPLYSYVREVDYCSGALLATPRDLFAEIGGFDKRFAPAYYEDVDYCFALRAHGKRVYYQPESVVTHFEGVSSGTDITGGIKRYQAINQGKFVDKWADALRRQPAPPVSIDARMLHLLAVRDSAVTP